MTHSYPLSSHVDYERCISIVCVTDRSHREHRELDVENFANKIANISRVRWIPESVWNPSVVAVFAGKSDYCDVVFFVFRGIFCFFLHSVSSSRNICRSLVDVTNRVANVFLDRDSLASRYRSRLPALGTLSSSSLTIVVVKSRTYMTKKSGNNSQDDSYTEKKKLSILINI